MLKEKKINGGEYKKSNRGENNQIGKFLKIGGGKEPLQQGNSKDNKCQYFQFLSFIKMGFIMVIDFIAFIICIFCHCT